MTIEGLLGLRRTLSSALDQLDAMVEGWPLVRERIAPIGNLVVGNLVIDRMARQVMVEDEEIVLPRIEFELLAYLVLNMGRLVPNDELIDHIWPGPGIPVNPNNALKVHIRWLREKLVDRAPVRIVNRKGVGYRVDPLDRGLSLTGSGTAP